MKKYIIIIDQGTTSTRSVLFNLKGEVISSSQIELSLICQNPGWIEQDPNEIWESVLQTVQNVLNQSNITIHDVLGFGITNQRETTVIWNKKTGKPVYNAIVWQSRQSQEICDEWIKLGYMDLIQEKTGLIINSYFSASKIRWILDNVKGIREYYENDELMFGTIDSFLIYNLTGNHYTDCTNASRTMLFNINSFEYDEELLKLFNIKKSILPKVLKNSDNFGYIKEGIFGLNKYELSITSVIGDQQSALFGQCAFDEGSLKNTYGTGCFILMNIGEKFVKSKNGLLTTIGWSLNNKITYASEGSVFIAGSGINWLRDEMEFFESPKDIEKIINNSNIDDNVYFVPAFVGLGTPHWDSDVRGTILGITKSTTKADIICAMLNSIALQTFDVIDAMRKDSNKDIKYLGVDGGISVNNYLMQFQSNILGITLNRPTNLESTALGCCYLSLLNLGIFKDFEDIRKHHNIEKVFTPHINFDEKNKILTKWNKAIFAAKIFK